MRISISFLLIALGISGQSMLGQSAHASTQLANKTSCSDLPHKAEALDALRVSVTKARAAIAAVDLREIYVSYPQGLRLMNVVNACQKELSYADHSASRAEADPTLVYYLDAYSEAIDATKAVKGVSFLFEGDFEPIVKNHENLNEASMTRIKKWRDDLDDAAYDLDKARESTGKLLRRVLESVDKCAFGVVYQHSGSAR